MAAYAALVSVIHIIKQIQQHPHPPISLDQNQVESLTKNLTSLQEFLESYSHLASADALESRIADAAYAAEDIIESHIVDQIGSRFDKGSRKISSAVDFYKSLQEVIGEMDSIKKEAMEITKEKMGVHDQLQSISSSSSRSPSTGHNTIMVGFDDVLLEVMDKLTGGQRNRQIIPIVGMGGMGKTTLARNVYRNQLVVQRFDILAWVNVSQEYKMSELLLELLQEGRRNFSQVNEYELGERLHKRLSGRRYLIIMDDVWDIEVWDRLKFFFPDNDNGSRIILTTRLSNLATEVADSLGRIDMPFLDEDKSWDLFSNIVFGEVGCPVDWEEIGKRIIRNCRGLPLSIVVIGGFLAKSKPSLEYWEYIEQNLSSIVNLEDNERCLRTLQLSYSQLPIHLKPCFLYMGVFKEDYAIRVSMLIKLWVAEGFLKSISGKSLEDIAKEYLKELIDRNLVLVEQLGSTGSVTYCIIHDLLRDLCLREAHREGFYSVTGKYVCNIPQGSSSQRRIVIPRSTTEGKVLEALQSVPFVRSFLCDINEVLPSLDFRLLRLFKTFDEYHTSPDCLYSMENVFQLVNSRYLTIKTPSCSKFPSSIHHLWNLSTLIVDNDLDPGNFVAPIEIWNMPHLRHVMLLKGLHLPDPPSGNIGGRDDTVGLENLQTLLKIRDFKCSKEMVKRIPNIKKLMISYEEFKEGSPYCLDNLIHLHKLEYLGCYSSPTPVPSGTDFLQNLTLPHSLKKLIIGGTHVHWEDMLDKIVSLPVLEKLTLMGGFFNQRTWETIEGHFLKLRFLQIYDCELEYWITESSHFPCLELLHLRYLNELKEIPSEIGEIPSLKSIELEDCCESVAFSAKRILEEQEELVGEVDLQVRVILAWWNQEVEKLASPNFRVECWFD